MNRFAGRSLFFFSLLCLISPSVNAQDRARGAQLYQANNCIQCHGVQGEGIMAEKGPRIGGQYDWYILKTLNDFKSGSRQNPEMMPYIASLSEQDYRDLAAYVATLTGLPPQ
jgi:cytochrome c553